MTEVSTRWVSIDGARFDLERGKWAIGQPRPAGASSDSGVPKGLVSVDGAWFDLARGECVAGPPQRANGLTSVVPEGFVSIDGALLPVELI